MQNAPINMSYVFLAYQPWRDSGKVAETLPVFRVHLRVALEHLSDVNTSYKPTYAHKPLQVNSCEDFVGEDEKPRHPNPGLNFRF